MARLRSPCYLLIFLQKNTVIHLPAKAGSFLTGSNKNLSLSRKIRGYAILAKENIKENPKEIVTDGLWSYNRAIRKEFITKRTSPNAVLHSRNAGIAKKLLNNNMVERYHNEFREFDKVRRGFKSDETAQQWSDAFRLYHNFIKKHMALNGATPSQVAEIDIDLGRNRWLSLLKQSLSHPNTTKKEVILK